MMLQHLDYVNSKEVILASQSPRRAEILGMLGLRHRVIKSSFAEDLSKSSFPDAAGYAEATATGKAVDVCSKETDADLVIAADTIVVLDGEVLEKPHSEGEAVDMLTRLSGRTHDVVTGVCLVARGGTRRVFHSRSHVTFDNMTRDEVLAYVRSGEPMDKAGAYGIQGKGACFVKHIDGCYFTVMGLPMHAMATHIKGLVEDGAL